VSWSILLWALAATPAGAAEAPRVIQPGSGLSAVDLFNKADEAHAAGQNEDALTLYQALAHDPDIEIRSEARFRRAMLLVELKRYREAAVGFRALLDEKPDATRVRLELARTLALMGDEPSAARELRQARAAGLPPEVATVVDQFAGALRSTKPFGGSLELDLAPDSNVNRATSAQTLDTVIAPLNLSRDARARSGVGLRVNAQAYLRLPIATNLSLVSRLSTAAVLYRQGQFNDISVAGAIGPELRLGKDRLATAIGYGHRYYGGPLYARTTSLSFDYRHPAGARSQLTLSGAASRARYARNHLQDGAIYDAALSFEHAFKPNFGGSITLSGNRQTAVDPGYATSDGGISVLLWRDIGKTTIFATASYRRLEADARLLLFLKPRRDDYYRLMVGATLRQLTVHGFAPLIRVGLERNRSTVGLYDYRRVTVDLGITRAF
jgi:tetratricopeptide (TPR) repeat protein